MHVRLTHLDGKLPNLALMKLAAYHRRRGDSVYFTRSARRDFFEQPYDRVYGSAIFTRSQPLIDRLQTEFPNAIIGGTGYNGSDANRTVEQIIGDPTFADHDYSIYPDFTASMGYTQRGCRMKCGFCMVPGKEGGVRSVARLHDLWRGDEHPRHIMLLDNDFFGQPKTTWRALLDEAHRGHFRLSFIQGINVRLVTDDETAEAIASAPYYDDSFTRRRLYTAFDNVRDEPIFRRGIERLLTAGVKGDHILAYMLIGYDPRETDADIFRRLDIMREYGIRPYPMVYQHFGDQRDIRIPEAFSFEGVRMLPELGQATVQNNRPKTLGDLEDLLTELAIAPTVIATTIQVVLAHVNARYRYLRAFQRWVIRRHYHVLTFEDYRLAPEGRRRNLHRDQKPLFDSDEPSDDLEYLRARKHDYPGAATLCHPLAVRERIIVPDSSLFKSTEV